VSRLGWAADPGGWFRRVLAIILILVGLAVIGGYDKKFLVWSLAKLPPSVNISAFQESLISKSSPGETMSNKNTQSRNLENFNVEPYQAPELQDVQNWINSDPQTLEQLKGKVVLIDFWTYTCINCIRTQPYLNAWYDKYKDKGFVIIGVHAPEFAFEKLPKNVQKAVTEANIKYPVTLDNNFTTWSAYENKFWPAKYLIDRNGLVRYTHFGEGKYEETEAVIQSLLKENGADITEKITSERVSSGSRGEKTPETYLSYSRGERFTNKDQVQKDISVNYVLSDSLKPNEWSLGGNWKIGQESSVSGNNAKLKIKFSAREVYLVMSGPVGAEVKASVEGKALSGDSIRGIDVKGDGAIVLDASRLYKVVRSDAFLQDKELLLTFPEGVTINAFTFGN
jgi:thiol-disulfide isomerase/thioredoxin